MTRPATGPAGPSTGTQTLTLTLTEPSLSSTYSQHPPAPAETLSLRLKPPKKKVTWKEGTVDNEFLQRKSSKICCVFHKHKSFDEDASDDEEDAGGHGNTPPADGAGHSGCCSHGADHQSK